MEENNFDIRIIPPLFIIYWIINFLVNKGFLK